jgi:hypothetical protein
MWITDDPLVATFWPLNDSQRGVLGVQGPGFRTIVDYIKTDMKPTLAWPAELLGE